MRSYSKHTASSIFRVADLDWADLGRAWGLLRLPKMPECKTWVLNGGDRSLGLSIDWANFAYKDKKREEQRKAAQQDAASGNPATIAPEHSAKRAEKRAWSNNLDAKDEREVRREKRHKRRDREKWEAMTPAEREEKRELERLIEEVKAMKKTALENEGEREFEGFEM